MPTPPDDPRGSGTGAAPQEPSGDQQALDTERTLPLSDQQPPGAVEPSPSGAAELRPTVPGYELLDRIGAGGMGEVWLAEQREPVQRRVAVKLIRPGMGSPAILARFAAERQALALMDHPGIAKVFDAGTTSDGRPFVAMELVQGAPVTEYCDRHRLSLRERLELFVAVCEAVHHAHQKTVLHRDIKPSNILVGDQEGRPAPKVIDFGLAKALAQRLTDETLFTRVGEIVGTPEYMSPEQADPSAEGVDTRSDVYSLGMVLYELLVGSLPFDRQELRRMGVVALQRHLLEHDPPRPSARLTRLGETSTLSAEKRHTSPAALVRALRGDLDWIVMRALEKDPRRRYPSVHALTEDIRRYLANREVEARPPSVLYRAGKLIRRRTLEVTAAAVMLLALVSGTLLATVGLLRARAAEEQALREATTARQVTELLIDVFDVADPGEARGRTVTAREILEQGAQRVRGLAEEPLVRGRLLHALGRVHTNLGLYDEAEGLLGEAVALLRDHSKPEPRDLVAALHNLGVLFDTRGRYDEAEATFREALALVEGSPGGTEEELDRSLNSLAVVLSNRGLYAEARDLLERTLELREARLGPHHPAVVNVVSNLGSVAYAAGDLERAAELFERGLAIERQTTEPGHPRLAGVLSNLGSIYQAQGLYQEAREALEEALAIWSQALGDHHADVGIALHNLANLAREEGDLPRAVELYQRSRGIWEQSLGPGHMYVAISFREEAEARRRDRQDPLAEELLRTSVATWERGAPGHPGLADTLEALAALLEATGRQEEAEQTRDSVSRLRETQDG
jgi:eukaryotic-like serine/threonine-protein kinase